MDQNNHHPLESSPEKNRNNPFISPDSDSDNQIFSSEAITPEPSARKQWVQFNEGTNGSTSRSEIPEEKNIPEVATIFPSKSVQLSLSGSRTPGSGPSSLNNEQSTNVNSSKVESHLKIQRNSQPVSLDPLSQPAVINANSSTINSNSRIHSTIPSSRPEPSSPEGPSSFINKNKQDTNVRDALQSISLQNVPNTSSVVSDNAIVTPNFANGDIIVTLLPLDPRCIWVTPAKFKPELVPEELMAQNLTLTVEDYVSAMQILVNDLRFNMYIVLYKRVLAMWISLAFIALISLLFSGLKGLPLFGGGVIWLVLNATGIFACIWAKFKLNRNLERCVAQVNALLIKHNILLGVDDRGKLSCHKINIIFVYFDTKSCCDYLKTLIDSHESGAANTNGVSSTMPASGSLMSIDLLRLEAGVTDITINGPNPKKISMKEKTPEKLLLRYSQRWVKEYSRMRIDLHLPLYRDAATTLPIPHRHCTKSRCLCQFIEEHLKYKPLTKCSIRDLFI